MLVSVWMVSCAQLYSIPSCLYGVLSVLCLSACPFVAGVASLYLNGHPSATHSDVKASLLCSATSDVLSNQPPSTANLLLYANVQPCASTSSTGTADFSALPSSSAAALHLSLLQHRSYNGR